MDDLIRFACHVNGDRVSRSTGASHDRLLDVLREQLQLTGTKEGCGEGECGACSVMIDGELVNSCLVPLAPCRRRRRSRRLKASRRRIDSTPSSRRSSQHGGAQCGICTPGMVLAAVDLSSARPQPTDRATFGPALAGNLCRCTGYMRIFEAVLKAPPTEEPPALIRSALTGKPVGETLELLASEPGRWRAFAGGTDLMVLFEAGKLTHSRYLSLWHLRRTAWHRASVRTRSRLARSRPTPMCSRIRFQVATFRCCAAPRRKRAGSRHKTAARSAATSRMRRRPPTRRPRSSSTTRVSTSCLCAALAWCQYQNFHHRYKQMDLRRDELIRTIRLPRSSARHGADLAESRHAPGAGDIEGLFRRVVVPRRRDVADARFALRQRCAHRRSRPGGRSGGPRPRADRQTIAAARDGPRVRHRSHRRPALDRTLSTSRRASTAGGVPHIERESAVR